MRRIPARLEQTDLTPERFPLFAYAGRSAANAWLASPVLSLADFRDMRFRKLIDNDDSGYLDTQRRAAFNQAFVDQIAVSIAQQSRSEASHE
jgi:hypothetical protein